MLTPETVNRDEHGDWTHSALIALFGDREQLEPGEWDRWRAQHQIETAINSMEYELDEDHPAWIRHFDEGNPGSVGWNPEPPGDDWQMLSIHDTEDGPVVVWYREKVEGPSDE